MKKCPVCNSTRLVRNIRAIRCNKCGYINERINEIIRRESYRTRDYQIKRRW